MVKRRRRAEPEEVLWDFGSKKGGILGGLWVCLSLVFVEDWIGLLRDRNDRISLLFDMKLDVKKVYFGV